MRARCLGIQVMSRTRNGRLWCLGCPVKTFLGGPGRLLFALFGMRSSTLYLRGARGRFRHGIFPLLRRCAPVSTVAVTMACLGPAWACLRKSTGNWLHLRVKQRAGNANRRQV